MPKPRKLAASADPLEREGAGRGEATGRLVLVVGPSGAGKDTLINAARVTFAGKAGISFCERHITRADQTGEPHRALSDVEFARLARDGRFFLSWRAHGLSYGIGADVLDRLQSGETVVVNASRRIVEEARRKWPATIVLHVTASPDVLRERLLRRGREDPAAVDERLRRATQIGCPRPEGCIEVDNSGALADSVVRFNAALAGFIQQD